MTTTSTPQDTNYNIEEVLQKALSSNRNESSSSMSILEKIESENFFGFLSKLGKVLSTESSPTNIRQLSAIVMKNSLVHMDALQPKWKSKLSKEQKDEIKVLVLSTLASSQKEIRKGASSVIASICKIDQPIMTHWPELIPSLTQNVFNENINLKLAAIEALGFVCEELTLKGIDTASVDSILTAFIKSLEKETNKEVIYQILKSMFNTIKLAEKNFSTENEMKIIMDFLFNIIKQNPNDDVILEKLAMNFIEMFSISSYYDYISPYMPQIFEFSLYLVKNKSSSNEKLALLGLEIICTIGDEEVARGPNEKILIKTSPQGLQLEKPQKQNRQFFNKMVSDLRELILQNVSMPEPEEDDNEWTISKGCLYILSILVRVVDKQNIVNFLGQLKAEIEKENNDINTKCKCWLLLANCMNTVNKKEIGDIIQYFLISILKDIDSKKDIKLQRSASYLLVNISKSLPKIFEIKKFDYVIPQLLNALRFRDSRVAINITQVLQNIIQAYGDKETLKSSNYLSDYFVNIFQALFIPAQAEAMNSNDEHNLCLNRLLTIDKLISYSSHDKQEIIHGILIQFLKEIESIYQSHDQLIAKGASTEKIFQLQDYYYTLLRTIFFKYKKEIDTQLGQQIWILTDTLFKQRKTVFEEANFALGALALNMKGNFAPIFKLYCPFLEFSIKSFSISTLSKSGLTALLNSIRALDNLIIPSSASLIQTLIEVCTSAEVSRANKTIAITCIGELAIRMESEFVDYLKSVMGLLFSACQMGLQISEDEDEDTIDFIRNLRFELLQTLTCISFAMEERKELLVPYIPDIFGFFKSIVNDIKCQRHDILKSMLGFVIDMVNMFGVEIKPLCDQNFASALITNLRAYNIPQYESEINQCEHILRMLFSS